ncbi:MAG: hypothetical protein LE180_04810, partial [Endomicrobium sp.]|uniref:hypothetical protein n=1 Tax=Candidatus Endomicrobiellum pyrsonymphae TaxID=1408203 RepID=UPI003585A4E4|nr:hypothetical protein [Endomicrobium sp.]
LIAFVYPLSFQKQATQCKAKMKKEFELALERFEEKQKISYEPLLLFGIEDLVLLLRREQDMEDEESILKYIAAELSLGITKIIPSLARKLGIPKLIPVHKGEKHFGAKALLVGLQILTKYNPNLRHYTEFLEKISKNKTIIDDLKK